MAAEDIPRRFWTLDVLRGVCALVIFVSHWILFARFTPQGGAESATYHALHAATDGFARLFWPLGGNHPAVICFFVLSGFCIHVAHARAAAAGQLTLSWRSFYRRRFLRIMPVYWTATLLGLVLVSVELRWPSGSPLLALHTRSTPVHALVRLLGLTDLFPREILAGNGPLNTVGIELLLYAAYPLFYAQAARGRWALLGGFFVALELVGLSLLPVLSPFWVYNSVFMFGLFWFAGAYLAHVFVTRGARRLGTPLLLTWITFVVLNFTPHFYGLSVVKQTVFGLACVFGVMHLLSVELRRPRLALHPGLRGLRYVGLISYSMYAVHTPVLLLGTWALLRMGITEYGVQLAVTLGSAVGAMLLVHYCIERVFYRPHPAANAAPVLTQKVPAAAAV